MTFSPDVARCLLLVLAVWCSLGGAVRAASPIALPSAQWIAAPSAGSTVLRRTFTAAPGVQSAVLLVAGNGTALLNGERAGDFGSLEKAASFAIGHHVRTGENVLTLQLAGDAAARVAFILQLVFDTGRHEWIVSDELTRVARGGALLPVTLQGKADAKVEENPFDPARAIDAYNSWMLARGVERATDPATIRVPAGFTVELLRSALPTEDSWVAMAFDPEGRITVAREKAPGLLRLTLGAGAVEKVEVIEETLRECRGLLYAHGALYAHANNTKALVRLRDTDGDDRFDEVKELLRTEGGTGHGRNHLRPGPDGMIYVIVGDDVALPSVIAPESAFPRFAPGPWIPGPRDTQVAAADGRLLSGWLARTDRDGSRWEIIAGGLRNPLDVAFNEDGEMFTYEADNERDIGNPWYKPSRVHHLVSGGDYAWRRGTAVLPSYAADVMPTMHDVGLGSPTGVEIGTQAKFPAKYRRALYIADWAYGRILALQLEPRGAGYTATREEFAVGRPLNVTDMAIGPDGAFYFTTGGRGTQSGLYRIRYTGALAEEPQRVDAQAAKLRALRRSLEVFHTRDRSGDPTPVLAAAWPQLGHEDRWIANAARVALETVPTSVWRDRALTEKDPATALSALLALARIGDVAEKLAVAERVLELATSGLPGREKLTLVRICEVVLPELPASEIQTQAAEKLNAWYPARDRNLDRELCKLLVNLRAPDVIAKTTALLTAAETQEDRVYFLFLLRHAAGAWTIDQRRVFFDAVQKVERGQGAQNFVGTIRAIKAAAAATLTGAEWSALAASLEDKSIVTTSGAAVGTVPHFVREWTLEELVTSLERVGAKRSFARGREAFESQCRACHRMGSGPDAGGVFGPDLTAVASRFGRRDLLVSIMDPSRAIDDKYRNTVLKLRDGGQVIGVVESESPEGVTLRPNPLSEETMLVRADTITALTSSAISPMPAGLLNFLDRDQILDLLAYLESGGDAEAPAFRAK